MTTTSDLDVIAFRFFKLFAQYEYALKAMGYGAAGRSGQAEPDWDRFANEVGIELMSLREASIEAAKRYILDQPPKRQVWIHGSVAWEAVSSEDKSVQALFGHIRRVRNNLYHGGKFNGRWIDPDRSRDLISHSLMLLDALIVRHNPLREAIHGNAA